tara:strand:- start:92 stop:391 length:300 start_codon:yes stop_codon:yes gene_type:complete
MSLLSEFKYVSEEYRLTVIQSYSGVECNEYEFFDSNNRKVLYVNEYFVSPIDNEKLDHTVYELYYDNENTTNNHADDDFLGSNVYDDLDEFLEDLEEYL